MKNLVLLLPILLILIGCRANLSNPKDFDFITQNALDLDKQSLPWSYSGWAKRTYPNGQISYLADYNGGSHSGPLIEWHENGQKSLEHIHKNGKLIEARSWKPDGTLSDFNVVDGNGVVIAYNIFGNVIMKSTYEDGLLNGKKTFWYATGQKRSERYFVRGDLHGVFTTWYLNGKEASQASYEMGRLVSANSHTPDGIESEASVESGNGLWVGFYSTGQKRWEYHYQNGKLHGSFKKWKKNGENYLNLTYRNGEQINARAIHEKALLERGLRNMGR